MKKCENCETEHDASYSSGRFCSMKCSRGFSTKVKRKEINEKVSKKLNGRTLSKEHILNCTKGMIDWSRTEEGRKKRSENTKASYTDEKRAIYSKRFSDRIKTPEFKAALSKGIKKTVEEGNWPGWKTRMKGETSWAERYFMDRFDENNITYEREFKINRFWVDFAFIDKKIVLEIDGKQHEYIERKLHDEKRDIIIEKAGWKIFRIKWAKVGDTNMYNELLKFIENLK
jgi:very-short-patch-repair endonuclease